MAHKTHTICILLLYGGISWGGQTASRPAGPVKPMELQQTRYEIRAGEPATIVAPRETLDFLAHAANRRVESADGAADGLVVGPNHAGDQVLVAAPYRTKPGEYSVKISATSASGEERMAPVTIVVKPRQTVPSGATRPPVVLLNGWETGFTGACPISANSTVTFGNLAQYLVSDGVPIVYFFDNCAEEPSQPAVEVLANDLGSFLSSLKYDTGAAVPQSDLVGFSMGGLIARAYLAGLQSDQTLAPPASTLVRDLVLIAVPNFGSFLAGNSAVTITGSTQDVEMIPGSQFLWDLGTWNQRTDDLRGVNALGIVGNAGDFISSEGATETLANSTDGVVTLTSATIGFVPGSPPTQIVPYCHIDPSAFTNTLLGTMPCNAAGIANVTNTSQLTGEIVRSFLAGTTDWQSIGGLPSADPYLSVYGGMFFAAISSSDLYYKDLSSVSWGSVSLVNGGDTDVVFYQDFVNGSGTGTFEASSQSAGTLNCGSYTLPIGFYSAIRCKFGADIFSVGPLPSTGAQVVNSGSNITLTGISFGEQCTSCQVYAVTPGGTQENLQIVSWSDQSISALLPVTFTGLTTIGISAATGDDTITIMTAATTSPPTIAATPSSLQFAYSVGGTAPATQSINITNSGTGTLTWSATASASWLTVSPASGTAPSTLTVSISPTGLTAGSYSGNIQIAATGASNTPVSIPIKLTVIATAATLGVTPQSLTFNYTFGGIQPASQNLAIANSGSGALTWTASASTFWIGLSAASGSAPATPAVAVNPANLAAGSYTGNVTVTAAGAAGSPASVSVTLVVSGTQPAGTITGMVNAADFGPGFASAAWVAIYGTNLSQSTQTWGASDFVNGLLPTSLDGVSVTINGQPAYVEYISPKQINVLAPDDATTGPVQVQVTAAKQVSNSFTAQKQQYSPAFFTFPGSPYVAALHANYTYLAKAGLIQGLTTTPAKPGETILLYGTGFGPTNPASPTSSQVTKAAALANNPTVTIGGVSATVEFAGLVEAGLYQLNVTVPSTLPDGDATVLATIEGVQSQTGVSITVQK